MRKTRTIFSAAAIVLIVIQTVGVVSLWGPAIQNFTDITAAETAGIRATREGLYNVSSKKNERRDSHKPFAKQPAKDNIRY